MAKKKVKRFDVWVTRNHYRGIFATPHKIVVSNTATSDIERTSGCTIFQRIGRTYGRVISTARCLRLYGFLPQPATCWNVWNDAKGAIHHQEYPLLGKYYGRSYKPKPIKSEQEHYL